MASDDTSPRTSPVPSPPEKPKGAPRKKKSASQTEVLERAYAGKFIQHNGPAFQLTRSAFSLLSFFFLSMFPLLVPLLFFWFCLVLDIVAGGVFVLVHF